MADPFDFTSKYNTKLSPAEERAFLSWVKAQSSIQKRDLSKDLYDYDLRGFWQKGSGFADNGHGADTFKKPNHPTFSNQSQYHNVDGYVGGEWAQQGDQWTFKATDTNLKFMSPAALMDYFRKVEPGNKVELPASMSSQLLQQAR